MCIIETGDTYEIYTKRNLFKNFKDEEIHGYIFILKIHDGQSALVIMD